MLLAAAGVEPGDALIVLAAREPASTATALDAAVGSAPAIVLVAGGEGEAHAHAEAWAADRPGWLLLEATVEAHAVLAPVATLAASALPGRWRGGRHVPARSPAGSARAALIDTRRDEADRLRAELLEQRAWVAGEAARVRASQSWRLGHALVRAARLLSFRRDRGTDALEKLIERMNAPP